MRVQSRSLTYIWSNVCNIMIKSLWDEKLIIGGHSTKDIAQKVRRLIIMIIILIPKSRHISKIIKLYNKI